MLTCALRSCLVPLYPAPINSELGPGDFAHVERPRGHTELLTAKMLEMATGWVGRLSTDRVSQLLPVFVRRAPAST